MASTIATLFAREIFDSYGLPALEGHITLDTGEHVVTSVPTMLYASQYDVICVTDNDLSRYNGKGLTKPLQYINTLLGPQLQGVSPQRQKELDTWLLSLDTTPNKSHMGANVMLLISQLLVKAAAVERGISIYDYLVTEYMHIGGNNTTHHPKVPLPCFTHIEGGGYRSQQASDFTSITTIPVSSWTYDYALHKSIELAHTIMHEQRLGGIIFSLDTYGVLLPQYQLNKKALAMVNESIHKIGMRAGMDIFCGIDMRAHQTITNRTYPIKDNQSMVVRDEYITYVHQLIESQSIIMIQDPLDYDDIEGWKQMVGQFGEHVYVNASSMVGGMKDRMQKVVNKETCSMITFHPLFVGTITESLQLIHQAHRQSLTIGVPALMNETSDTFIADFAVAIGADYALFGGFHESAHINKYMRLLHIYQQLEKKHAQAQQAHDRKN